MKSTASSPAQDAIQPVPTEPEAAIIAWTRAKQKARAASAIGAEVDDLLRADEQLFRLGLELIAQAGQARKKS
jgi:hypothetical protein